MILTPVYCSSDPPPASGPVRSKMTPILIFLSWACAETAIPSIAATATNAPTTRAVLTTSIVSLPWKILIFVVFVLGAITGGVCHDVKRRSVWTRHTHRHPEELAAARRASKDRPQTRLRPSFETPRKRAAPQDDGGACGIAVIASEAKQSRST